MNYKKNAIFWKEFKFPELKKRRVSLNLNHNFITTITGPRRSGKTYLCFQKINELLISGISKENIFYINFEDNKLLNLDSEGLDKLLETLFDLSDINEKQDIYLFFDEIQNVKNWDSWTRTIYDTNKKIKLILTGSSSKMLGREISTTLRGRVYNLEILPLSFLEYLDWSNIALNRKIIFAGGEESRKIKKLFLKYLKEGGYPAIFSNQILKDEILQGYFDSMILKDIIERYNIKEFKKIEILSKLVFESNSKEISYSKLSNKMHSLGFSIGKETIINYISYFEEAYLFFQVLRYEYSIQKQLGAIKKIYTIDNGLLNSVSFKFSDDFGKLLENLVFLELYRRRKKAFYNRDKFECDFVVQEKDMIVEAIQVCYELNDENQKREINGLIEATKKFNLKKGLILTMDAEDELVLDKKKIIIKPVWKWLLE